MSQDPANSGSGGNTGHNGMNDHVDYQLFKGKEPSWIARFLYKCAGADEMIIRRASYYDHMKYLGIGGVILATAFLALLSMGFAMHIIFDGKWYVTIPIAIIWSLIIFNLDRFIVSAAGKGDGKDSISGKEFMAALPRLVMAFFIGITISAPLETYIFQKEINREWDEARTQLALKKRYDLNKEFDNDGTYVSSRAKIVSDSILMVTYQHRLDSVTNVLLGTGCTRNPCPRHQHYLNYKADYESRYKAASLSYQNDTSAMASYYQTRKNKLTSAADSIKRLTPGFLDQLMMLHRLSSEGKTIPEYDSKGQKVMENGQEKKIEIYGKAKGEIWAVRLLFILIEITPVIIKMFLVKSAYDYMQENITQILVAKQGVYYKEILDKDGKTMFVQVNYNPERIIAVVEHQNQMEERNAKHAVTVFADKEKAEIDKDPDKFIKKGPK